MPSPEKQDSQPVDPVKGLRTSITAEEAAARVDEIKAVHESGFLTRREFNSIKRSIERRVQRPPPPRAV